jgi:hypothetical protein
MTRDQIIAKLLKELPELLGDYEHCARDEGGRLDGFRKRRIARIGKLLVRLQTGQW